MKEISISVAADFSAASAAFETPADTIEGEVVDDEPPDADPDSLPTHPLELEAYGDGSEESARAAWAAVIPIEELRHVDAAPAPIDPDDETPDD